MGLIISPLVLLGLMISGPKSTVTDRYSALCTLMFHLLLSVLIFEPFLISPSPTLSDLCPVSLSDLRCLSHGRLTLPLMIFGLIVLGCPKQVHYNYTGFRKRCGWEQFEFNKRMPLKMMRKLGSNMWKTESKTCFFRYNRDRYLGAFIS